MEQIQKKRKELDVVLVKCLRKYWLSLADLLLQTQHEYWHPDKNQKFGPTNPLNKNSQTVHNVSFWLKTLSYRAMN